MEKPKMVMLESSIHKLLKNINEKLDKQNEILEEINEKLNND